jgi:transcriptional regulator with XRE-family HTH domain
MLTEVNIFVNYDPTQICQNMGTQISVFFAVKTEAKERLVNALNPIIEKMGLRSYARSINVSPGAVSKWINGDSFPDGDNRERVAASLGLSLEQFNAEIVRGEARSGANPLEQTIRWIGTASKSDLVVVLRAVADKLAAVS